LGQQNEMAPFCSYHVERNEIITFPFAVLITFFD
jgi:hypothetical protein